MLLFLNMVDEWRLARDGRIYSLHEFVEYYGHDQGHLEWAAALQRVAMAGPRRIPTPLHSYDSESTPSSFESADSTETTATPSTN